MVIIVIIVMVMNVMVRGIKLSVNNIVLLFVFVIELILNK